MEVCLVRGIQFYWYGSRRSSGMSAQQMSVHWSRFFFDWVCSPKFLGLFVYYVFMRLLFGPTVVPYSACNEGFIYWLLSYVYVFFPVIPPSVVCLPLFLLLVFSQYFSPIFVFSRFLFNRCLGLWGFDQDALLDDPIQGLVDWRKTTVLSSRGSCSSLLYHRAYCKWKEFAVIKFNGSVFPT